MTDKAPRYEVNLYDKDNDYYEMLLATDDFLLASTLCSSIAVLFDKKLGLEIIGTDKKEPFDWVEVYDFKELKVVQVNQEIR